MAGIYRRGRTWWARAQRQGREFRRSLKTADRSIAERRLRGWLDELDRWAWGERPTRTFDDAAERFAREHAPTLRPASVRRYKVSLMHLLDQFSGVSLLAIGSAGLADFETRRRSDGVSAPTIRRDLACLSSLLGCAVDWEWIDANPVPAYLRRRRRRGLRESPPRTRYLTHAEEIALLSKATAAPRRAIAFSIDTGLRREEQFGLTWDRVDLSRGRITLGRNTKSGTPREIPLLGRAARILAQLPRRDQSPARRADRDAERDAERDDSQLRCRPPCRA